MRVLYKLGMLLLAVLFIMYMPNGSALSKDNDSRYISYKFSDLIDNEQKKVVIYPKFIITQAADFAAFRSYMNETKEEYRTRRANELTGQSQVSKSVNVDVVDANGGTTITSTTNLSEGADPDVLALMIKAYERFNYDYDINKYASQRNIGIELSGQLQSNLLALKEYYLMSDKDNNIIFSYGQYSPDEANERISAWNMDGRYLDSVSGDDMADVATHFIYGHWSYIDNRRVKITLFIEQIGGTIKAFDAIGEPEQGVMKELARNIFAYLHANRNYVDPAPAFAHLEIIRPYSMDDMKTHDEASMFCGNNNARLPYIEELIGMVTQKFGPDGSKFMNPAFNYAIADKKGDAMNLKAVSGVHKNESYKSNVTLSNERLNYFCVRGDAGNDIGKLEDMYENLLYEFATLRKNTDNKITYEVCSDSNSRFGVDRIKDIAIKIAHEDKNIKLKGLIKQCVIVYLKQRPLLYKELNLIRKL